MQAIQVIIDQERAMEILNELRETNSIFTIEFVKRSTGERRVMNARFNVRKHLRGGGRAYNPATKNLMCCYDLQKKGYRSINLDCLLSLRCNGNVYLIENKRKENHQ